MRNRGITDPQKLLEGTAEQIEDGILEFVQAQKKDGVSGDLVNSRISAIKKFYKKNRMSKLIDWEYIREDIGEIPRKTGRNSGGNDYTVEQVRVMRKIADEREAAVLMLYWSAGVRRGVGPALEKMDLRPIDGLAGAYDIFEITGYRGFAEEYKTWCSPESRSDIEAYFRFRERHGEVIGPRSPVFRAKFNTDDPFGAKYPQKISEQTIYNILAGLAERAGIREQVTLTVGEKPGKVRHEVKAVHGLRKGFDTVCTNSGVTPLWVEFFEGRQLVGSKGRYYRPTDQQLLEGIHETNMRGYVHAIDSLTINEAGKLKKENVQLQMKVDDIQLLQAKMAKQEEELAAYRKSTEELMVEAAQVAEFYRKTKPLLDDIYNLKKTTAERQR